MSQNLFSKFLSLNFLNSFQNISFKIVEEVFLEIVSKVSPTIIYKNFLCRKCSCISVWNISCHSFRVSCRNCFRYCSWDFWQVLPQIAQLLEELLNESVKEFLRRSVVDSHEKLIFLEIPRKTSEKCSWRILKQKILNKFLNLSLGEFTKTLFKIPT